jgi:YVTN family beta-propeller protein
MRVYLVIWLYIAFTTAATSVNANPTLSVDTPFVVQGGNVNFTVTGEPGAAYVLLTAQAPGQIQLGGTGTLYLSPGSISAAANGVIGPGGTATAPVAFAGTTDQFWYTQAMVIEQAGNRLSNSITARIVTTVPSGPRETLAVAVTPDGSRAYVGNPEDGAVSVVNLANGAKQAELAVTVTAEGLPFRPIDLAIDPEGRHLFVVNTASNKVAVIDVASDSTVAQIRVPRGSRRVGFDFSQPTPRIYITNEVMNAVLVFEESATGRFTSLDSIPLQGDDPTALLVLGNGRLVVGNRATHDLEFVDPFAPPGSTTLQRTPIEGIPFNMAKAAGQIFVPTFIPGIGIEGFNRVLTVDPDTFAVTGFLLEDVGTDYIDVAATDSLVAVIAASTGTVIFADPVTGALVDNIELAPGDPTATPQQGTFVQNNGLASRFLAVNYFRETVRPVVLEAGPPFSLEAEIPLAWSGAPRVPLSGDLTDAEDGDWFFRSVNMFGGSAFAPNRVTCFTCHIDGGSDNIKRGRVPPPMWGSSETGPWGLNGNATSFSGVISGAINNHNHTGRPNHPDAATLVTTFFENLAPPDSIYKAIDGTLSQKALQGRALFHTQLGCSTCHAPPLYIPNTPVPKTIQNGIGTGLVPANVPSLRGIWATAPYLANGSAASLLDVLTLNPNDLHGQLSAGLTSEQLDQLVAYLLTL